MLLSEDGRLLGDYETEQLCEKLSLVQLSVLRKGLEAEDGSRTRQQSLLRVLPLPTISIP